MCMTGYWSGALEKNKDLQEPFLRAHLTAATATNEGELHIAELPDAGIVGVALWYVPQFLS